jgi:hypothetical protein
MSDDPRGPRFAAAVKSVLPAVVLLTWSGAVALLATVAALGAAFLSAAVGACLGCELYLLFRRSSPSHKEVSA